MFKRIDVTDIKGFRIGNAENEEAATGCTVIVSEKGATAGVDVRGGSPATSQTDLLRTENTLNKIHAVVLSGGSAFGLEAGAGVTRELEDMGIGYRMGDHTVPIVCQAALNDLGVGRADVRPDRSMGTKAVHNAFSGVFDHGNRGAGTGASVGKFYGMARAMKTGLGTFACSDGEIEVGAVTAVNAFADIYDGANNIIAGLLSADKKRIDGTIRPLKLCVKKDSKYQLSNDDTKLMKFKKNEAAAAEVALMEETEETGSPKTEQTPEVQPAAMEGIDMADVITEAPAEISVAEITASADEVADAIATLEAEIPAEDTPDVFEVSEAETEADAEATATEAVSEEMPEEVSEEVAVEEASMEEVIESVDAVSEEPAAESIEVADAVSEAPEETEEIPAVIAEEPAFEMPEEPVEIAEESVSYEAAPAEAAAEELVAEDALVIETVEIAAEDAIDEACEKIAEETARAAESVESVEEAETAVEEIAAETEEEEIPFDAEEEIITPILSEEDMGYNVTFNTTISCLITNAKLTKAQANQLASILHDGYARSVKPVHSTVDGDTIFVMTTGEKEVNFDAFAALATDILQYSVIDGAISATEAYGLPAASSFLEK